MKPTAFHQLLGKSMSRQEFLTHLGAGLLAVVGVSAALRAMGGPAAPSGHNQVRRSSGYGGSAYGA